MVAYVSHDRFDPELHSPSDRPIRRSGAETSFPIGVFEDAAVLAGNTTNFQVMANDVLSCGQLQDLEGGRTYSLGESIPIAPGDGKIFELVNAREIIPYIHLPIISRSLFNFNPD